MLLELEKSPKDFNCSFSTLQYFGLLALALKSIVMLTEIPTLLLGVYLQSRVGSGMSSKSVWGYIARKKKREKPPFYVWCALL